MNLVIDWGNSSLKTGWFDGDTLQKTGHYRLPDELLADLTGRMPDKVLISSTNRATGEFGAELASRGAQVLVLDGQTPLPMQKAYDTPHTLGADRVAAGVGAMTLFPQRNCLVLDLGTCLTADWIDHDATFRGGLISPGLRMRFRAMHEQTARLPLIEWPDVADAVWPELTAKNTRHAMQSGVLNGLAFELNGIITYYRQLMPDVVVLLCGGDAPAFESRLKPPIFAVPELVLVGLNRILRYNVKN